MSSRYKAVAKVLRKNPVGKALRKNPIRAGLGASLLGIVAAAAQSPALRARARRLTGNVRRRLSRHDSLVITSSESDHG